MVIFSRQTEGLEKYNTLTSAKIELSETSQKIDLGHNSTPVIEKEQIDRTFDVAGSKSILIFLCVSASRFFYLVQKSNINFLSNKFFGSAVLQSVWIFFMKVTHILILRTFEGNVQMSKTNLLKSVWKWYETCMSRLKFNKNVLSELEYFI